MPVDPATAMLSVFFCFCLSATAGAPAAAVWAHYGSRTGGLLAALSCGFAGAAVGYFDFEAGFLTGVVAAGLSALAGWLFLAPDDVSVVTRATASDHGDSPDHPG